MTSIRTISPTTFRQLAVTKQRLSGTPPTSSPETMLDVVHDLGCLQLDPISAVAKSHLLVLWSRLGNYDRAHLDKLLWEDRSLFEFWAHAASIVLTEDYPIHRYRMGLSLNRVSDWVEANHELRDYLLNEIRQKGALVSSVFEDKSQATWDSSGWTNDRNVNQMLGYLWDIGTLMIAGRNKGGHRLWDLTERVLPDWVEREEISPREVTYRAAQKSLRALGVARQKEIKEHYTRSRYPELPQVMNDLEKDGRVQQVSIVGDGAAWPDTWYIHVDDLPLLEQIEGGSFQPRTTLLSPFDNLICDRARTEKLFNFEFRIEIYVPKEKRKYGYYVLPILHGDQLIGRIDPMMNRKEKRLYINNVYAEPTAPLAKATGDALAANIQDLAAFLGAEDIAYGENIPKGWKKSMN